MEANQRQGRGGPGPGLDGNVLKLNIMDCVMSKEGPTRH